MNVYAIVACAKNNVIGRQNAIPWYLPADLQYFKKVTIEHPIIMGRKCFESIGRPLPRRQNIVITRDPYYTVSGCIVVRSIVEALEWCEEEGFETVFIIGGGEIYQQTMAYWDRVYLTEVDLAVEGDVFFPALVADEWREIACEKHLADSKNEYDYTFKILERK